MTSEERIIRLHERAVQLQQKRNRTIMTALGGISACLSVFLLLLVTQAERVSHEVAGSQFTGSSMLSESAGGYVLVAVIAFAAGVLITTILRWYRDRKR